MTDTIDHLPLSALHESPFNPRKAYSDRALQELAESIRSQGVMQPIVVRVLQAGDARLPPAARHNEYEIVFGHRRFRASAIAELDTVPCIVRDMSDEEAALAQLHENLEREDVSAMEEAEAFDRLVKEHKVSIEQLMKQTGKSRTYIYDRLKLCKLAPVGRDALAKGVIDPQVAVLIARVPDRFQDEALKRCTYQDFGQQGHPVISRSFRECQRALKATYTVDLSDREHTPFDTEDHELVLEAGACSNCPRNTNIDATLADYGANVCTMPSCHETKVIAFKERKLAVARSEGRLIEGEQAADLFHSPYGPPDGFVDLERHAFSGRIDGVWTPITYEAALARLSKEGADLPAPTVIVRPAEKKGGRGQEREYLTQEQADALQQALMASLGLSPEGGEEGGAPGHHYEEPVDHRPLEHQAVLKMHEWRGVRAAIMGRVVGGKRSVMDLQAIALRELQVADGFAPEVLQELGWHKEIDDADFERDVYLAKIHGATADQLAALMVLQAVLDMTDYYHPGVDQEEQEKVAAWRIAYAKQYGVDVLQASGLDKQTDDAGSAGGRRGLELEQ